MKSIAAGPLRVLGGPPEGHQDRNQRRIETYGFQNGEILLIFLD